MSIRQEIEQSLSVALNPSYLEVVNESHTHNVPPGSESHFKVTVVASVFKGQTLVQRHRQVNSTLREIMTRIHALALHTYTEDEWLDMEHSPQSPPCQGGSKAAS